MDLHHPRKADILARDKQTSKFWGDDVLVFGWLLPIYVGDPSTLAVDKMIGYEDF